MDYEEKERSAINSTDKKDRESNKIIDEANRVSECDSKVIRKRQVELIEERRRRLDEFIKAKNLSKE